MDSARATYRSCARLQASRGANDNRKKTSLDRPWASGVQCGSKKNGADGISDIEGKVARASDERIGKGASFNRHFDHDIQFSKGGSSLTAANVRLLCAKHNLEKSDKILTIAPWIFAAAAAMSHVHKLSG